MTNPIDKLAWLYIRNRKVLVARSKGKTLFYLPGGKRDVGESDHQALIREVSEEISVDLLPASIRFAAIFEAQADGKSAGTTVRMTCYFADFTGSIAAAAEIEEVAWLDRGDKARCSANARQVLDWLAAGDYIE
ncbi:MAG: NUDIX domain-containing protein [Betaproteobacteria bacterium]